MLLTTDLTVLLNNISNFSDQYLIITRYSL